MKAAFHTLGCKVNSYETQAMLEQFRQEGWEIADFTEQADVYIINTCSVTQMAEHKSRQLIHRAKRLNPDAVIVAAGCYAQRAGEELLKDPMIDIVAGNNHKSEIVHLVNAFLEHSSKSLTVTDLSRCFEYEPQNITHLGENIRAYVKIQDGCNRFCSYCIIPYVRGRSRLRDREDIVNEVRALADSGYREVVLTGIDISMYTDLIGLAEDIEDISGIDRVRLGSLEAGVITEDFIKRFSALKKACPQFHLSLQSGCDETLKRMNRRYTTEEYAEKAALIRDTLDICTITTDVIVGFPGETDEEFAQSLDFVKRMQFMQTHVFKYSRRKGTKADTMPDQVPENVKNTRSALMIEAADLAKLAYEKSLIGTVRPVLIEEQEQDMHGRNINCGFSPEYTRIAVESSENLAGRIADCRITGFTETQNGRVLLADARHLY